MSKNALLYPINSIYPGTVESLLSTAEESKPDPEEQKLLETVETPAGNYRMAGRGDLTRLLVFAALAVVALSALGFVQIEDAVSGAVETVKEAVTS